MEKITNNISIKSRLINKLLILSGYKNRYSSKKNVKKYIEKNINKKYNLPEKMGLNKENISYIDVFSYNGNINNPKDLVLVYIHGGSYIEQAINLQIRFAKKISKVLDGTLIMPVYKTAPKGNYEMFQKSMDKLYDELLKLNKKIIFVGDSAGAGFALSYSMNLRNDKKKLPSNLILFSPWIDVTFSNPNVKEQCKMDNICSIDGNLYCGKIWAGNIDVKDYRISPINGNFKNLPRITVITGGYDICKPDCIKLKEKLKLNNLKYDYLEYYNQCHNFQIHLTKEAIEVIEDIAKIIKNNK